MLSADLVRAKKRAGELTLTPLTGKSRQAAFTIAESLLALARAHVGRTREELASAVATVSHSPAERKLALGLAKLVEDACEFSSGADIDAAALRSQVFLKASAHRQALAAGERFDRDCILSEVARELELAPEAVELGLYSDLRSAELLLKAPGGTAVELIARYEEASEQAVLLRAVKIRADVVCQAAADYRALFHKLKFRRLLYALQALPGGGYRIEIDGPFSVFESVTKYGLQLALILPALKACDRLALTSDVLWGKQREPLVFRIESQSPRSVTHEPAPLPDEVTTLLETLANTDSPWRARPAQAILDLPGAGLCVPDIELEHAQTGEVVYLEVMGYWSRDAVFRRVELVEQGLTERIVFAVSSRLRVSQAVLEEDELASLYVYKGTMSARSVLSHVETLAKRRGPASRRASKAAARRAMSLEPKRR